MHMAMVVSQIFSVILYFVTILMMKSIFMVSTLTWEFFLKILLLTFITWFPLHMIKILKKYLDPNDYEKIMMANARQSSILMSIV
jgi:phospholipid-translocating ATPase